MFSISHRGHVQLGVYLSIDTPRQNAHGRSTEAELVHGDSPAVISRQSSPHNNTKAYAIPVDRQRTLIEIQDHAYNIAPVQMRHLLADPMNVALVAGRVQAPSRVAIRSELVEFHRPMRIVVNRAHDAESDVAADFRHDELDRMRRTGLHHTWANGDGMPDFVARFPTPDARYVAVDVLHGIADDTTEDQRGTEEV